MDFFNTTLPRNREGTAETVTDSFRVITHDEYRLIGWHLCKKMLSN